MSEIAEAAFQYQVALEKRENPDRRRQLPRGVGHHDLEILRVLHEVEVEQVRMLAARRQGRDAEAVRSAPSGWSPRPGPTRT